MMKQTIIISINTAWNVHNYRSGLVKSLLARGYEVVAVAPDDEYADRVRELGCRFVHIPIDNNGTNPWRDLGLLARYFKILHKLKPVAFLGYTVKPNVYGSIAAHALGIPVINNIAGLGATFITQSYVTAIVRWLYKLSLKRSHRVFFQNADDQGFFVSLGLVKESRTAVLPGSGLNLAHYRPSQPRPVEGRSFRFLLIGRLLKDKGVEEYAAAARELRTRFPDVECQLLGFSDAGNANAIPMERVRAWESEGLLRYLGKTDDVRPFLDQADCVVLPSYREGVPRALLEAAAMARPIVATDVVGCRDAVDDGSNGYLCRVRDPIDLAEKMASVLQLGHIDRLEMGAAGRAKVEREFDEQFVINKYVQALHTLGIPDATNVAPLPDPLADQDYLADH
jgi:glycosyltransferase involved in cell wall biosynthesis